MKLCGILIASALFCAGAFAQDRAPDRRFAHPPPTIEAATHYTWAVVLRVDPVFEDAEQESTKPECEPSAAPPPSVLNVPATHDDGSHIGGTVAGAIVGGLFGNLFGRGNGRRAAMAAGALAGAALGDNLANAQARDGQRSVAVEQADPEPPSAELPCAQPPQRRITGYDVEYSYKGEIYLARLAYDPGDRLRVRISVLPAD